MIKDQHGQPIYGINTHRLDMALENLQAGDRARFRFAFEANLGKGHYSVAIALSAYDSHLDKNYEWRDHSLIFHVLNQGKEDFVGSTWLGARAVVEKIDT